LGLLALLAGATTAPEARPPSVKSSLPPSPQGGYGVTSYAYQVQLLHLSF